MQDFRELQYELNKPKNNKKLDEAMSMGWKEFLQGEVK